MRNLFIKITVLVVMLAAFSSCSTFKQSMKEPNVRVELEKSDFELSEQVSAEATCTKIVGIDFQRLFSQKEGEIEGPASVAINLAQIPVVGNVLDDKTANYALYELMQNNKGYDVVVYPQYETKVEKPIGIGFIVKTTTVKATARLGKLKN